MNTGGVSLRHNEDLLQRPQAVVQYLVIRVLDTSLVSTIDNIASH